MSPNQLLSSGTIWERKIINADKDSKEKELIRKNVSNVKNNDVQPNLIQLFKKEKYESIPLLMGTLFPIILYCMNTRLGIMQDQDFAQNIIIHLKSHLQVLNWDIQQEQGSINLDLDMDLDLKIDGFGYGLGLIFLNGFGYGFGFENRWI